MCVIQAVGGTMTGRLRLKRQCPPQADTWDIPSLRSVKRGKGYCWWRITSSCSPPYKPEQCSSSQRTEERSCVSQERRAAPTAKELRNTGKSGSSDSLGLQLNGSGTGRGIWLQTFTKRGKCHSWILVLIGFAIRPLWHIHIVLDQSLL